MGLIDVPRAAFATEGLTTEAYFIDFKAKDMKIAFKHIRYGVTCVHGISAVSDQVDVHGNVVAMVILAIPGVPGIQAPINAQRSSRLLVTSITFETGRETTTNNLHFQNNLCDVYTE